MDQQTRKIVRQAVRLLEAGKLAEAVEKLQDFLKDNSGTPSTQDDDTGTNPPGGHPPGGPGHP